MQAPKKPRKSITVLIDEPVADAIEREAALQLSDALVDDLGGLAVGYTSKLLGAAPVKTLGHVSLSALLAVLAVKLLVVVDDQQSARIGRRWQWRDEKRVRCLPK